MTVFFRQLLLFVALLIAANAHAAGMGWRVSDDAGNSIYLIGTVHAATEDMYPLPDAITRAFDDSSVLVLEVDPRNMDAREMERLVRRYGLLPNRESLRELLPPATWQKLVEWGQRVSYSAGQLNRMRPWLATTTLVSVELATIGVDRSLGMEQWLVAAATERDMPVRELETAAQQIALLGTLPIPDQIAFLENSFADAEDFSTSVHRLLGYWRDGDIDGMAGLMAESYADQPHLYQLMIVRRNHEWLAPVLAMLDSGATHYVAVGALHLVGPEGLVALLSAEGYSVERL